MIDCGKLVIMGSGKEFDIEGTFTEAQSFKSVVERRSGDKTARGMVRDKHELYADEPEWLEEPGAGDDLHPAPVDYLVFGLASCQAEILDQALKKARIDNYHITVKAEVDRVGEDEPADEMLAHHAGRISHIDVKLTLQVQDEYADRAQRCLDVYDTGCVVGQSLREGIEYTPNAKLKITEKE